MIGTPAQWAAQLPAKSPLTTKARDYLSYSAITTYQGCPLRYYFRYVAAVPERTVSASLVFGSAVHRALEHHFNELLAGNEPPSREALRGEYDRHWQTVDRAQVTFGGADEASLGQLVERMFAAFQGSEIAQPAGRIIGVEEELRGAIVPGCPDVLGRIDLLVETADALVLTDFKTSRSRWSPAQVSDAAGQLLLYHDLVQDLVPRKPVELRFAVLTKTKNPTLDVHHVPVTSARVDRLQRIVERVWKAIQREVFYPAPSAANCSCCPFREPCRRWPH